ncbi:MAG: acyltransferase [Eubacterium sp.]|nr:acyltransferase [Eubacterium sp.]
MENKKRLANLDLLKVVSMVMIVCHHYLVHGGVLEAAKITDANFYVAWLIGILSIVGVNCFVLCSGYLMTENRFRFSKLVYLWLQIFVINLVLRAYEFYVSGFDISAQKLLAVIFPISFQEYWYMSAYFAFYLLSPLLIWIVNKLTLQQLKKLTIALVAIFALIPNQWTKIDRGYHVVWFCVLFFVAAYIRRADLLKKRVRAYLGEYLMLAVIILAVKLVVTVLSDYNEVVNIINVKNYNFILTFLLSVALFAAFKNMKIKSARFAGFCTFLAPLTLGVYLIHDNNYVREALWGIIAPVDFFDKPYFVLHMLVCVVAVFSVCAFLEYFRYLLFKLFGIPQLSEKLGKKIQAFVDRVFSSKKIERL